MLKDENSEIFHLPVIETPQFVLESYVAGRYSSDLERLYESWFATEEFAQIDYPKHEKFAFSILNDDQEVTEVILFGKLDNKIGVINQLCSFDNRVINLLCKVIFERFDDVHVISFKKQYSEFQSKEFEFFMTETHEDYIIELPEKFADYRTTLGKNIKQNMSKSINRSKRDFPDFKIEFFEKENVPDGLIEKAFEFNKQRMEEKGKEQLRNPEQIERAKKETKTHGLISCITVENQVASVTISTITGGNLYFHVIAHYPKYNYYRLGQVNLYLSIQRFIENGGKKFHFLWGEYDYKYRFNAKGHTLYSYQVLRVGKSLKWQRTKSKVRKTTDRLKDVSPKKVYRYVKGRLSHKK